MDRIVLLLLLCVVAVSACTTAPRGQCELVGGTGCVELGGKNLGDATCDDSP